MNTNYSKRMEALEARSTGKLFICIYKGEPPYLANIQRVGRENGAELIELMNDGELLAFQKMYARSNIIIIQGSGKSSRELFTFGQ